MKSEVRIDSPKKLSALGSLLDGDGLLLAHGGDNGDQQILAIIEVGMDLLAEITLGDLHIVLGGTISSHQVEEAIVDVDL